MADFIDFLNALKPVLQLAEQTPFEIRVFFVLFGFLLFAIKWGQKRHLLCVLSASQELKRIKRLETPQKQLTALRGVNPFVFEEMILTAIKRRGHKITRNKKYTGDGGIDGRCQIKGVDYLIQAKRYKNHINPAHVQEFAQICRRQGKNGLFIHTGKTGKKSQGIINNNDIELISGDRLLKMLFKSP